MDIVIDKLTKNYLTQNIRDFIRITSFDKNEYWQQENFERELPGKYELSLYAIQNNQLIGFIIASQKTEGPYIHKFMVHPDFRSKKIGHQLFTRFQETTKQSVSLAVSTTNDRAVKFYMNNGFMISSSKIDSVLKTELYIMKKEQ